MVKILVIEDDPQIIDNIQDILEFEEFDLILTENGQIGLQQAQNHLPDLIICDIMMPEMDGFEVLSALRQDEKTAGIPLIFLTAKADRTDFRQGMELGADDYLTKPFTPKELRQAIATRLEKKAQVEQKYTSQIQQISEQLNQQLYLDQITHLPNRFSLRDQFEQMCQRHQKVLEKNHFIPILCLSLDRFSRIQSNLGYHQSDFVLKQVGERLKTHVHSAAIVAYLGAEEFALILPPVTHQQFVIEVINYLQAQLAQSLTIVEQEIFLSTSIGIALYPQDGEDIEDLLTHAKKALQQVQKSGGNGYYFYQKTVELATAQQLALEKDLRDALEQNQLEVYYQPQVSLTTRKIIGCEALLRWHHPVHQFVSPHIFIPLAEEIGLMNQIGQWVFNQACQQLKNWQNQGFHDLRMSINVSAIQFNVSDFQQSLMKALVHSSLNPKLIELELTETHLVRDLELAKQQLQTLNYLDFMIAIDDFGTGYSSLKYIQQLPFNTLKIDRIFVQDIDSNASNAAITSAVIQMAHNLNLYVVAEGVETPEELNFLIEHQCDAIQGYLFSRPLPVVEFEALLKSKKSLL